MPPVRLTKVIKLRPKSLQKPRCRQVGVACELVADQLLVYEINPLVGELEPIGNILVEPLWMQITGPVLGFSLMREVGTSCRFQICSGRF